MNISLNVSNIKCGGCAKTITSSLEKIEGVRDVVVDVETGQVSYTSDTDKKAQVLDKLKRLGYPQGESDVLDSAKSYVSCMVGRFK